MINLLCPEPESFSKKGLDFLSNYLNLRAETMTQSMFDLEAPKYDAVLVRFNTQISNQILGNDSKIKSILSPTTGLDHIAIEAATKKKCENLSS